jgi:hypothetical protein
VQEQCTVLERNVGVLGVDGVQNALVANLTLGLKTDEAADVRVGRVGATPAPHGSQRSSSLCPTRLPVVTHGTSSAEAPSVPMLSSSPSQFFLILPLNSSSISLSILPQSPSQFFLNLPLPLARTGRPRTTPFGLTDQWSLKL